MTLGPQRRVTRFGAFELDLASGELLKHGIRVKLRDKPFQILLALLERPGDVITRKELQERLWPGDTFVEFENGLNNAISRLRETLGDNADRPLYIETLPRRGYRFVAPLEMRTDTMRHEAPPAVVPNAPSESASRITPWRWWPIALALVAAAASVSWYWPSPRPAPVPSTQAIAVLPFVPGDAREASADHYVAFGMTEALITELSRVGALKVISQTSVMQYKGVSKALPEVARELGAGTIVEGSVLREGDQVRITVQLIDARTDTHLWAQSYMRDQSAALAGQRQLAREVAGIIRSRLVPSDRSTPPVFHQTNPPAYEAYVKGRYAMQRQDEGEWLKGRAFFEQSIAADPTFAPAYVGLANYYVTTDSLSPIEAMPRAKANAQRALQLDEMSAGAHAALAFVHYFGDWDWAAVEREFTRAVELDPSDAWTRRWHALYLSAMGRHAAAIEEIQRAIELDPVSVSAFDAAGAVWFNARRFDKVLEQARRIAELSPQDPRAYAHMTIGHLFQGDLVQAVDMAQKGVAASARNPAFLAMLTATLQRAGRVDEAHATLAELNHVAAKGYVPDFFLGMAHLSLDKRDDAIRLLQRGYEARDGYLVYLNVTPWADALRGHPQYEDLLRRMNFPP